MAVVEVQILNYVLASKSFDIIENNLITDDYFVAYKDEFKFIKDHVSKYGNVPDTATFISNFNDFDILEVTESEKYLVDTIREEHLYYQSVPILQRVAELSKTDSNAALEYWQSQMSELQPTYAFGGTDIIHNADDRLNQFIERRDKQDSWFFTTGFEELDDIIHGIQRDEELLVIFARTGAGKCLEKGTKVLMSDGTSKAVEDVKVGDYVQSLNCINKVEYTHSGVSNGYKIIPKSGDSFVVSSQHILTLAVLKEYYIHDENGRRMVTNGDYELVDVTVEDYLNWSTHKKHIAKLFRPSIDYSEQEQTIPPYILGSWLGDGTSREVAITSINDEIINEWRVYAESYGLNLHRSQYDGIVYSVTGVKGVTNPITMLFRELGLLNNKHIPLNYLTGSYEQRLELLAGIIDTDGYYNSRSNTVSITLKLYDLLGQISQLCRGLGFKVSSIHKKHNNKYNRDYYTISINGDLDIIPNRISRKHGKSTHHNNLVSGSVTGFTVEPVDSVEYYGFQTDGDHRFLLWDNTLTHNTWVLEKIMAHIWQIGFNVGFLEPEMSANSIGFRFDTLVNGVSNSGLMWGKQDLDSESYQSHLATIKQRDNVFMVATPKDLGGQVTVSKLRSWVVKYKLDAIAVDGITYLDDERYRKGDSVTTSLTHISEDLMSLSVEMKIPVLVVVQANRSGVAKDDKDGAPELESIRDSDGISHNASKVLSLLQKKDHTLEICVKKQRFGAVGGKIHYNWDIDKGIFIPISINTDENADEEPKRERKKKVIDEGDVF